MLGPLLVPPGGSGPVGRGALLLAHQVGTVFLAMFLNNCHSTRELSAAPSSHPSGRFFVTLFPVHGVVKSQRRYKVTNHI